MGRTCLSHCRVVNAFAIKGFSPPTHMKNGSWGQKVVSQLNNRSTTVSPSSIWAPEGDEHRLLPPKEIHPNPGPNQHIEFVNRVRTPATESTTCSSHDHKACCTCVSVRFLPMGPGGCDNHCGPSVAEVYDCITTISRKACKRKTKKNNRPIPTTYPPLVAKSYHRPIIDLPSPVLTPFTPPNRFGPRRLHPAHLSG